MKNKDFKLLGISLVTVLVVVLAGLFIVKSAPNGAYAKETQIEESRSNITVQEKRRNDLVVNLVDTIREYDKYEQETLTMIVEARTSASNGDVENAQQIIDVIVEQYPELKSQENYKHLMNELSLSENTIAQFRLAFNNNVNDYKRYVKQFPKNLMLSLSGYEVQNYDYLTYDTEETLTNIWD